MYFAPLGSFGSPSTHPYQLPKNISGVRYLDLTTDCIWTSNCLLICSYFVLHLCSLESEQYICFTGVPRLEWPTIQFFALNSEMPIICPYTYVRWWYVCGVCVYVCFHITLLEWILCSLFFEANEAIQAQWWYYHRARGFSGWGSGWVEHLGS